MLCATVYQSVEANRGGNRMTSVDCEGALDLRNHRKAGVSRSWPLGLSGSAFRSCRGEWRADGTRPMP